MKKFNHYFFPYLNNYNSVKLSPATMQKVNSFVHAVVKEKMKEHVHQIDNDVEIKRWITGVSGEMAIEKLFGVRFFDWSIGKSDKYDVSDLKKMGIDVGIKTVEFGKFPVVHKRSKRPEIIVVKKGDVFYVCGLATVDVLNRYQDDRLILNSKLRARGVKTGFYGFEHLIPISSLDQLKEALILNKTA